MEKILLNNDRNLFHSDINSANDTVIFSVIAPKCPDSINLLGIAILKFNSVKQTRR